VTVFGDELHRYTLADGIRDHNVLGFDPYMVKIYDDYELREKVALMKAKAEKVEDVFGDKKKEKVYYKYMDSTKIKMVGEQSGKKYVKGIEDYRYITKDQQINLLIVVNQMLTGFDSKWINALYLDKVMEYENLIQAFSRTNRLYGDEKPFGTIKYYRRPNTMQRNIAEAVRAYSGDVPTGLFVDKLPGDLRTLNRLFDEITMCSSRVFPTRTASLSKPRCMTRSVRRR
jgi:type I site-specific restriction-modification system R (restriction) subunit